MKHDMQWLIDNQPVKSTPSLTAERVEEFAMQYAEHMVRKKDDWLNRVLEHNRVLEKRVAELEDRINELEKLTGSDIYRVPVQGLGPK